MQLISLTVRSLYRAVIGVFPVLEGSYETFKTLPKSFYTYAIF